MSISITTVSFADLGVFGPPGDFELALEPSFLVMPAGFGGSVVPQVPVPISTTDFPDIRAREHKRRRIATPRPQMG